MEFIDRQEELKALENFWTQKSAQMVVVYGKRRVGKTELIKHFMQDKASLYFLARKVRALGAG